MKKSQTILYLVRHGETLFNTQGIIQGHSDSELTNKGKKQAEDLGNLFKNIAIDEYYSSDLNRAVHTAEIIKRNQLEPTKIDKNLREKCYGRFERKIFTELKVLDDLLDTVDKDKRLSFKAFPDVESDSEVAIRMVSFIKDSHSKKKNKTILAVTHGGSMRSLLLYLGWGTYDSLPPNVVKNTSYIKLLVRNEKIEVVESVI
ncbi:MAG: histidine phosphatase family protein [Candidatus Shapirobacteria bacterium]|jgi:broad specificity phosphatase PhoE